MTTAQVNGVSLVFEHNNGSRQTSGFLSGEGSTFTYQVTGTGTATIQGSNDGVNWVGLTDAPLNAGESLVLIHSWMYLQITGTATVLVSRG